MVGLALLAIGGVLLWAAFTERGDALLQALNIDLPQGQPFDISGLLGKSGAGAGGAAGGKSSSGGTSLFNVPIVGPDGGAGTIQVVAHDAASAVVNASQGGNTATGGATSV